jgi:hypothetical protein
VARRYLAREALSSASTRTLVSEKLRTLMDFFSIEAPAARVIAAGEALELLNGPLGIVASSHDRKVVPNQLVRLFRSTRAALQARAMVRSSIERVTFMYIASVREYPVSRLPLLAKQRVEHNGSGQL